ncbi:BNR repeat-containing protein [Haloferula sp.]|uniref:BNR repeat-containing protein n=1 Tax=Haloferula sp. TaxID=2497595 RepID=UPI003C734144
MELGKIGFSLLVIAGLIGHAPAAESSAPEVSIEESLEIGKVPSGFPVGFCLLTAGNDQYVGFYDQDHNMTVAFRELDSDQWQYQILPSKIGWDSHNYITMALDDDGHLHVSGNMHNIPLIYFRTEKARDITSLKKAQMTGEQENRVTYPNFLKDHEGRLIFNYRNGGSGNGRRIYNKYDDKSRTWTRLMDTPLLDGEGKRNAYPSGPVKGPDGSFHMLWVWRDTPDCATNNHLSYARSKDLIHWESAFGEAVELPLRLEHEQLWVDPIPSGGGIINGGAKLGFDSKNRPIISYHKRDADGNMQIFAARPEKGKWSRHLLTDWNKPINFSGNGSMGFIGIRISEMEVPEPGVLTMKYRHRDYGSGRLVLDETTFKPLEKKISSPPSLPEEINQLESDFDGMQVRQSHGTASVNGEVFRYVLKWETLDANRDQPRQQPLPPPSTLRLYKISRP